MKWGNDVYKKDQWKLKYFKEIVFLKKFYMKFYIISC